MNAFRITCLLVLPFAAAVLPAVPSLAQTSAPSKQDLMVGLQPPVLGGESNAALLYFQAFERLSREDGNLIGEKFNNSAGWYPDEAVTKVLVANQRFVDDLMFAANTPACDFGVRYDQGFEALLPHLSPMRRGVRTLLADARRLVQSGDHAGAGKRIAAVFRIGDHTRHDRLLISSLVGSAITSAGITACEALFTDGKMSNEVARAAVTALKEQHEDDYLGFRGAVEGEASIGLNWTRATFKGPTAGADFVKRVTDGMNDRSGDVTNPLTKFDEAQLNADLDRLAAYYDEVRKAWSESDVQKRLGTLEEELQQGKWGLSARVVGASFRQSNASYNRVRGERERTIKRLDAFLRGEDPDKVAPLASTETKKSEGKK